MSWFFRQSALSRAVVNDVSRETSPGEQPPQVVVDHFPEAIETLVELHHVLATDGVTRGLIGPREVPRLWDRHLLNCAVVAELIDPPATAGESLEVADVGSGAGLPGLVLAAVRPDLQLTLIEPLARRATFLLETIARLDMGDRAEVIRGRAEDLTDRRFRYVTARAVAPLDRLFGWCLPLVAQGGDLLAMKGSRASEELALARSVLQPGWGATTSIDSCGLGIVEPATTVVRVHVAGLVPSPRRASTPGARRDRRSR